MSDKTPDNEKELNELLKVKREKLSAFVEAGKDPFKIVKYTFTNHSKEI